MSAGEPGLVRKRKPDDKERTMQRPATWKILTIGAALAGLSIAGAGTAFADSGHSAVPLTSVAVPGGFSTDGPFDDLLDDLDDVVQLPYGPGHFAGFDDDWYDDGWGGDDDWGDD
jgi:hypothetical protein